MGTAQGDSRILVEPCHVALKTVGGGVIDTVAAIIYAPLCVHAKAPTALFQDQFCLGRKPSITVIHQFSTVSTLKSVREISVKGINCQSIRQIHTALFATLGDVGAKRYFGADGAGRKQHVLHFDLCDLGYSHAASDAQEQYQAIAVRVPAGAVGDAE
jgi:hypothetical protein